MDRFRRQDAVSWCKRHKTRAGRMYGLMMDAFRDSQGEQQITRDARHSGAVTTTRMSYGDPKYLSFALRYSREQLNAALTMAELPEEYFLPTNVECLETPQEEIAREADEDRERLEAEAAHQRRANDYVAKMQAHMAVQNDADDEEEDDELEEDEELEEEELEASESPARVGTAAIPAAAGTATGSAASDGATADADAASEIAEIMREQHRREAKRETPPVQSPNVLARRRALARALAG
jgi:hypothetical protein